MLDQLENALLWFGRYNEGIVALGVFIAAAAAIWGSYKTSKAAHSTRISELRQIWIEGLRDDIVQITRARIVHYNSLRKDMDIDSYIEQISTFKMLSNKIKLKLNKEEEAHKNLIEVVDRYIDEDDLDKMLSLETEMIAAARVIFRNEWKRAVRGDL